jgi:dipeptidyl-peptidase-4
MTTTDSARGAGQATDTFPRQQARTQRFTLGNPRSFAVSPDGSRVAFLRSRHGTDPVTCLWVLDVGTGRERLVADPAAIGAGTADLDALDPQERARRERARERALGIVGFATDSALRVAAFTLAGRILVADLAGEGAGTRPRELTSARTPAADPRPDPAGRRVAYASGGALRVIDLTSGEDRAVAEPEPGSGVTLGLAEFVAAEEMGRMRGYWWAPDGSALLTARVDDRQVRRWYIADPANPDRPARQVGYPAAGTPNADVSLVLVRLDSAPDGRPTEVTWDRDAFPYLVTACWEEPAAEPPLIVVQSRDQRRMRLLAIDTASGATSTVREDFDPRWLEIVPGVPARTDDGRIAWTADIAGARRLLVASAAELGSGAAEPVTPDGLQVREVLGTDGRVVLFAASGEDPAEIGLWVHGPAGLSRIRADGVPDGVATGQRGGGTTVVVTRSLDADALSVAVLRAAGEAGDAIPAAVVARIASLAERPRLPAPRPDLFWAGERAIRTALLLPSGHSPGVALPVLMAPYGGPHGQQVLAARGVFLGPQWLAEQGFAVVVADGRGTPGRGPDWERTMAGDMATPALEDQVEALHAAASRCPDLDLSRVGILGWSFGGYLAALAVLRRPDVFHAAVAGAPVTDWRLYDTHYTERYLGHPDDNPEAYERNSLLADAPGLRRPLLIIHGLADDNVVVAHSLRLSSALLAAGRPHAVLPLSGVTHMASQEQVAENLLLLQVDFLRRALTGGG